MRQQMFQVPPTHFCLFLQVPLRYYYVLMVFFWRNSLHRLYEGHNEVAHPNQLLLIKSVFLLQICQLLFCVTNLENRLSAIILSHYLFFLTFFNLHFLLAEIFLMSCRMVSIEHFLAILQNSVLSVPFGLLLDNISNFFFINFLKMMRLRLCLARAMGKFGFESWKFFSLFVYFA